MDSQPWTSKEVARLRALAHHGAEHAATELGRTTASVRRAAHRHRISLRQRGERRGVILGQPRGTSFLTPTHQSNQLAALTTIRAEHLAGRLDMARIEQLANRTALLANGTPLCPNCARNPQERLQTGLCHDCHLHALAQAHRDHEHLQHAQRDLWRERQRRHRTRTRPPRR